MIEKLFQFLITLLSRWQNRDSARTFGAERSSKWSTVRKNHLKYNPTCAVCNTTNDIDVHHCIPFHKKPELELEESNLITLCTPHHYLVGHLMNWKSFNAEVRMDAQMWNSKIKNRP